VFGRAKLAAPTQLLLSSLEPDVREMLNPEALARSLALRLPDSQTHIVFLK